MSLKHKFSIIKKNELNEEERISKLLEMDDNLFLYFSDSFQWIKCYWNSKKTIVNGLDYYGCSVIEDDIEKFISILEGWISLFTNASETFTLTGNYQFDDDSYEKNSFQRDEVVMLLHSLVELSIDAKDGQNCIFHEGI